MFARSARSVLRASLLLVAVGAGACSSANHGAFVWINDYAPAKAPATGYVIGIGDMLTVSEFNDPKLVAHERVRPDGKISFPLLGEVSVADKAPAAVADDLEKSLKDRNLVLAPRVSVHVDEMKPLSVSVLGKVGRPGAFAIEPGAGVAQAIASAGGLTEFAKKDQIYLTRQAPAARLRFTFEQLTGENGTASQFKLKSGDVIIVY
jgi:polysaccharide export outer membrane protein